MLEVVNKEIFSNYVYGGKGWEKFGESARRGKNGKYQWHPHQILEIENIMYKINCRLSTKEKCWKTIQTIQNLNNVTQRST